MRAHAVAGFLVAVLPLVATPGASLSLLSQRVAVHGARHGVPVVLGTVTGLYLHATLAVVGLSALVMRSSQLFTVVRLVGAGYLVALGGWLWWRSGRPAIRPPERESAAGPAGRSTYLQALAGNVLNPKAASIYLTLVPQFVDPRQRLGYQILVLATAHALLIAAWLTGWTAVLARARHALRVPRFAGVVRRVSAAALVLLGLRAAAG